VAAQKSKPTPTRFLDNGNGTVTDNQTGLMWEKKTDNNVNDRYSWSITGTAPDGTLFTSFLATMQCTITADGSCGLAGHYDWRIPNISELQTIRDCTQPNCLDPVFGPTAAAIYWSTSADASGPQVVWLVAFPSGNLTIDKKVGSDHVRAVRGGL